MERLKLKMKLLFEDFLKLNIFSFMKGEGKH